MLEIVIALLLGLIAGIAIGAISVSLKTENKARLEVAIDREIKVRFEGEALSKLVIELVKMSSNNKQFFEENRTLLSSLLQRIDAGAAKERARSAEADAGTIDIDARMVDIRGDEQKLIGLWNECLGIQEFARRVHPLGYGAETYRGVNRITDQYQTVDDLWVSCKVGHGFLFPAYNEKPVSATWQFYKAADRVQQIRSIKKAAEVVFRDNAWTLAGELGELGG